MMGSTVADSLTAAIHAGADLVGANCGTSLSLDDYVDLARELVASAGKIPVILQPNAGSPQQVNNEFRYAATPDDMARLVPRLVDAGVRIIGGCCGTTPGHLTAMSRALATLRPQRDAASDSLKDET
jgi:5-methyltetrahydrofolate--homocysteine methyltransferase